MEVDRPNQAYCNELCMERAHALRQIEGADIEFAAKVRVARSARRLLLVV
jgi:hypothetical protein